MRKGVAIAIALLLVWLTVAAVVLGVIRHFVGLYNPDYHGKLVHTWVNQATRDENPAARQEAAQVLVEAVRNMEGEPRTQLLLDLCNSRDGAWGRKGALPKEVLPVLLEALRAKEEPTVNYTLMALQQIDPAVSVPALEDMLRRETDDEMKQRIRRALHLIHDWPGLPDNHHAP
jgi:hypothetical protein